MFTRRAVLTGLSGLALSACAHRSGADALRIPAASARRRIEDLVYSAMVPAAGLVVRYRDEVVFAHTEGLAQGAAGEADRAPFTPETAFCAAALSPLAAAPHDPRFAPRGPAATLYTREDEGLWQVQTEAGECAGASFLGLASLARAAGRTSDLPGVQTYQADTSPIPGVKLIGHQGEAYGSYSAAFHAPDLEAEIAFAVTGTSVSGTERSVHHPVMIKATEPLWAAAETLLAAL
ncbi:hypothetical protein BBF93_04400 [Hyphomonas sp. CACIAM 19H1]|uniref:hypothetical protein n=1 Tax=Hyphomonas sp. CACIAM 19H1 TaxID=1873716 RepID=UPI000DED5471|nr:hypothetical protein [Hyphomonas sp. CACIAM 19H1]AXE63542.1 hypothetical protein BBF93_04400 [Hyphomonas sp. CACIAM 19H1]